MQLQNECNKKNVIPAFGRENYGKVIDVELSEYLRKHTGKFDRAEVCNQTGVGTSTIRDVVFRTTNLTVNNSKAIVKLIERAISNCENSIKEAQNNKRYFKKIIS